MGLNWKRPFKEVDRFLDRRIGIDDPTLRMAATVLATWYVGGAVAGAVGGGAGSGAASVSASTAAGGASTAAGYTAGVAAAAAVPATVAGISGATIGAGIGYFGAMSAQKATIPNLAAPLSITPTSQVQREASTALADLNMRLRQAGSRGKSNMGIEQLKPLPSMQGPRLGAKLG